MTFRHDARLLRHSPRLPRSPRLPAGSKHTGPDRKLGGQAPSRYLPRIQAEKQVALDNGEMNQLLESHALSPDLLRKDAFDDFLEDRRQRLSRLVETAMGKPVIRVTGAADHDAEDQIAPGRVRSRLSA